MSTVLDIPMMETGDVGYKLFGPPVNAGEGETATLSYSSIALNAYIKMEQNLSIQGVPYTLPYALETAGYSAGFNSSSPQGTPAVGGLSDFEPEPASHSERPSLTPQEENNSLFDAFKIDSMSPPELVNLNYANDFKVYNFESFLEQLSQLATA